MNSLRVAARSSQLFGRPVTCTLVLKQSQKLCSYSGTYASQGLQHDRPPSYGPKLYGPTMMIQGQSLCFQPLGVTQVRGYAKGKSKGKDKKAKGGKPSVDLSPEELNSIVDFDKYSEQLDSILDDLEQQFSDQLKLRSSTGALNTVTVETEDGKYPLIQLGSIVQKNPQLVVIDLSAAPQYIKNVKTALSESGMNLNPQQDGTTLFVQIPKVTRDHREQLVKNAKQLCQKSKEHVRALQNKYTKDVNKAGKNHSEDLTRTMQQYLQTAAGKCNDNIDKHLKAKEAELLVK